MTSTDHLPDVLAEHREDLPLLMAKAAQPNLDREGNYTASVSSTLRTIGVLGYLLERDAPAFRARLAEAGALQVRLFDRFEGGEPISPSYVSMMTYKDLLDALASGEMTVAQSLADRMGGRDAIEGEYDRLFELAMGYGLKAILAGDEAAARSHLDELMVACQHKDYVNFAGYPTALRAILANDAPAAESGFVELVAGHRRESKGRGLFSSTVDEWLCVWGVGLANLAWSRGVPVRIDDPLIPNELRRPPPQHSS